MCCNPKIKIYCPKAAHPTMTSMVIFNPYFLIKAGMMNGNTRDERARVLNKKLNWLSSIFKYSSISDCRGDIELPVKEFPKLMAAVRKTTKTWSCAFLESNSIAYLLWSTMPLLFTSSSEEDESFFFRLCRRLLSMSSISPHDGSWHSVFIWNLFSSIYLTSF